MSRSAHPPAALRRRALLAGGALVPLAAAALLRGHSPATHAAEAAAPNGPPAAPAGSPAALAESTPVTDPRLTPRGLGATDAPRQVLSFIDLTCSVCAAFHRHTLPQVQAELIEPGQLRLVMQLLAGTVPALAAAAIAVSLPTERFGPFVSVLFREQERWAFTTGWRAELARYASLAGLPRAAFDATLADEPFKLALFGQGLTAKQRYAISHTPTTIFGTRARTGPMDPAEFRREVAAMAPG
jgi:protein-disulfide isomerase